MTIRALAITSHSDLPETETFIGLKKAGVDIKVMCPPTAPHYQKLISAQIPVIDLELTGRHDKIGTTQIRNELLTRQYHILHVFNNKATANGIRAAKGLNLKIIAYRGIVGNVSFFDPASWATYLNPRVDRIVCVAEAIRQYLLNMGFLGFKIPQHKPITIYKGHDLHWYQQTPVNIREEFNIPEDAFVVGSVANIRPRKGIPILIESLKHLPNDAPIHLLLVGNMNSKPLQQQIQTSPLQNKIHIAGFRPNSPQIMAACDAFVLPAIKREGLPKTVIEAMAYGIPSIVTNAGGSPELIEHEISGLIIPPASSVAIADAITKLWQQSPEQRKQMGDAGQQRIRDKFTINNTIKQTLELYQELFSEFKE